MPADDAEELFDVVDPITGDPVFVEEEEDAAAGRRRGSDDNNYNNADDDKNTNNDAKRKPNNKKLPLRVPRGVAHATGTWHASVYVHVSRSSPDGRSFLLQRRSASKDVCPLLWDLACAEHVAAGETRTAAALRGLREELGLRGISEDRLGGALGEPRQAALRIEGPPLVWDREVVTSYWLRGLEGVVIGGGGGDDGGDDDDDDVDDDDNEKGDSKTKTRIVFDEQEVCELRWVSPQALKKEVEDSPRSFTPWLVEELKKRPELFL